MKISANCLVKNEERFIWYAINSVIEHLDELLVWDNGSHDKTVEIIKSINNPKIHFKEKGETDEAGTARLRQQMLDLTNSNWVFILDGDEIWWEEGIREIRNAVERVKNEKDLIVSPVKMLIGDLYHYQEERAGKYRISAKSGHFNVRAIRRGIPGLRVEGVYGNEGFTNGRGIKIQDLPEGRLLFSTFPYLHASHLIRSGRYRPKYKYELGIPFPLDYYYPEVLFKPRPPIVPNPWIKADWKYSVRAFFETPLKKIKRRMV